MGIEYNLDQLPDNAVWKVTRQTLDMMFGITFMLSFDENSVEYVHGATLKLGAYSSIQTWSKTS